MKMTTAVLRLTVLGWLAVGSAAGLAIAQQAEGQKATTWASREEYDAYMAFSGEKDLQKKVALGDAFLQKFPNTFIKDGAYVILMQTYGALNDIPKAMEAGYKAVEANPGNLEALNYLSFVFPFVFQGKDPDAAAKLDQAEKTARLGLEALQKLKKPDNVTDDQFNQFVRSQRANYNGCIGFVALQRKDHASAVSSFKLAAEDNPADVYVFYRLGIAYITGEPRDYNNAIWSLARSASLAKAGKNPAAPEIERYLKSVYVNYHGNDEGLADIMAQAAASPTPPEGFHVTQMEVPKETGNPGVDAFNKFFFVLKYGGERAQKIWDSLKGQEFGVLGFVESVEPGPDPKSYTVKIDLLDNSKATDGVYDIELHDASQPNVKNLSKGDGISFKGTIAAYSTEPNLVITLDPGTIDEEFIPDQPRVTAKPKPAAKPKPKPKRTT
jgi:tetratricopeptide (TPR) repeat protein